MRTVNVIESSPESRDDQETVVTISKHVNAIKIDSPSLPVFNIEVNPGNLRLKTLSDTGSEENLIAASVVRINGLEERIARRSFIDFNGMPLMTQAYVMIVRLNDQAKQVKLWVFPSLSSEMLLGFKTLEQFGITLSNIPGNSGTVYAATTHKTIESIADVSAHFPQLSRPFSEKLKQPMWHHSKFTMTYLSLMASLSASLKKSSLILSIQKLHCKQQHLFGLILKFIENRFWQSFRFM